jgi:hypothetical protein
MKQYFDVYIRLGGARIPLDDLESVANIVDSWDRLEFPELKASIKISPQTVELGDGTQGVDGEKVEVESGTFRCDIAEHNYLRDTFHNQICDVLFHNPQSQEIVAVAYGLKVTVSHIVSSGESRVIKLAGARSLGVGAVESGTVVIMASLDVYNTVLLTGTVYESDGVTPVEGAIVSVTVGTNVYEDETDKDGKYLILARDAENGMSLEVACIKGGKLLAAKQIVIDIYRDNVLDMVAKKGE